MNVLVKIGMAGLFAFGLSQATVNFPFPQNSNYNGNATLLSDKAKAAEDLKQQFQYWLKDMYNEQGDVAGVRSNPGSNEYFSEGVGYGMLMMVYFSDNTTSYQDKFDKIWNFYKKSMDKNGLMNWNMNNLSGINGAGAALDGDIDAAAALVMAYFQFGDEKYKNDAKTLIQNMKKFEFEENGLHLPGDSWGEGGFNRKNPGYFDPAYMPLFALIDEENAEFWKTTAYDANMKLYESSSAEVSTGLIDDWTDKNGKSEDDMYSYDASRAPWRNAKAVCWHGDKRALAIDKKIAAFVSGVSAKDMKGPVSRSSGGLGNDHNSTFVTSLMTSLISDASYQAKLDEYWAEAVELGDENYFNQSLKILNGLLVSGNMPDLSQKPSAPESSSSIPESSSSVLYGPETSSSIAKESSSSNGSGVSSSSLQGIAPKNMDAPMVALHGRILQVSLSGMSRVDLVSVTGVVLRTLWNGEAMGNVGASLIDVPSGRYILRIQSAGSTWVERLNLR